MWLTLSAGWTLVTTTVDDMHNSKVWHYHGWWWCFKCWRELHHGKTCDSLFCSSSKVVESTIQDKFIFYVKFIQISITNCLKSVVLRMGKYLEGLQQQILKELWIPYCQGCVSKNKKMNYQFGGLCSGLICDIKNANKPYINVWFYFF